jgi:aryl-alcohol dehydrogenase-like predicted oxidoreductase
VSGPICVRARSNSPLGRGFLTAAVDVATLDEKDFRRRNLPAQVALAWVYAQADRLGVPVVPIPGTKRIKWLEQNVAALDVTLTPAELAQLDPLASQVTGARY